MNNAKPSPLLPWSVKPEHRRMIDYVNLDREERRRAGRPLTDNSAYATVSLKELDAWLAQLKHQDVVVHYDPDTDEGWFWVARRPGVDNDIIREPEEG